MGTAHEYTLLKIAAIQHHCDSVLQCLVLELTVRDAVKPAGIGIGGFFLFIMSVCNAHTHTGVRGQLMEVNSLLLPCRIHGLNSLSALIASALPN